MNERTLEKQHEFFTSVKATYDSPGQDLLPLRIPIDVLHRSLSFGIRGAINNSANKISHYKSIYNNNNKKKNIIYT